MSDSPKDRDFDWVKARLECCEEREFVRRCDLVEKHCAPHREARSDNSRTSTEFAALRDGLDEFLVTASEDGGEHRMRRFDLRGYGIAS